MIINLATDRNSFKKRTLVPLGARSLLSFRRHVHGIIRCPPNTLGNFSKCLTPQGLAQEEPHLKKISQDMVKIEISRIMISGLNVQLIAQN
jgi:hypothetical protein